MNEHTAWKKKKKKRLTEDAFVVDDLNDTSNIYLGVNVVRYLPNIHCLMWVISGAPMALRFVVLDWKTQDARLVVLFH